MNVRSERWTVRPSFVPHGPTSPVTLLLDDAGLTQLVGEPSVAWQTPWSAFSGLQLVRFSRALALFASVDGVRYCWRTSNMADYDALASLVTQHGGQVRRRKRRALVVVVAVLVVLASLAGGIAASLSGGSSSNQEITQLRDVNLSLKDLPSAWYATSKNSTILSYLFGTPGKVIAPTTVTTTPVKKDSAFAEISTLFQHCLGVPADKDRMYGSAGQQPLDQISSSVFGTTGGGGLEVASLSQYYSSTTMVQKDTAEMRDANFGACFAQSEGGLVRYVDGTTVAKTPTGMNFQPVTFVKGFSRGGVVKLTLPDVSGPVYLVMVQLTGGHYETTLGALITKWPVEKSFVDNLANTLLSRMTSTTSAAV